MPDYRPGAHELPNGADGARPDPVARRDEGDGRSAIGASTGQSRPAGSVGGADLTAAENAFRQALEAERRGDHATAAQAWQRARALYEAAVQARPDDAVLLHRLAIVCDKLQDFAAAEDHYLRALLYRPDDANLLSDYGYSLIQQNRLPDAEHFLQRAVRLAPRHIAARNNLGLLYALQGRTQDALAQFRAVGSEDEARAKLQRVHASRSAAVAADRVPSGAVASSAWPGAAASVPSEGSGSGPVPPLAQTGAGQDAELPPAIRALHAEMEAARRAAIEARRARERAEREAFERRLAYERNGAALQPPPWPGSTAVANSAGAGPIASNASPAFPPPGGPNAVWSGPDPQLHSVATSQPATPPAWPPGAGPSGLVTPSGQAGGANAGLPAVPPAGPAAETGLPGAPPTLFGRLPVATGPAGTTGPHGAQTAPSASARPFEAHTQAASGQSAAGAKTGSKTPSLASAAVAAARIGLQTGPGTLFGGALGGGAANRSDVLSSPRFDRGQGSSGGYVGADGAFGRPVHDHSGGAGGGQAAPAAGPHTGIRGNGPVIPQPIEQMAGRRGSPDGPSPAGNAIPNAAVGQTAGGSMRPDAGASADVAGSLLLTPRGEPYRPVPSGTASLAADTAIPATQPAASAGALPSNNAVRGTAGASSVAAMGQWPASAGAAPGGALPAGVTVPGQLTPTPPWLMTPASGSVATDVSQQLRRYDEELRLLQQKLAEASRPAAPVAPPDGAGGSR